MKKLVRSSLVVIIVIAWANAWAQPCLPIVGPDPSVPSYLMNCPSPTPSSLGRLGIAVDGTGRMYRSYWDVNLHPTPEILRSIPCGTWTSFPCQDGNGNPVGINSLAWDCDDNILWGGNQAAPNYLPKVYTIQLVGNIAVCTYMFTIPGASDPQDLAWDHSDQSLWWVSTSGGFASEVFHVTAPLSATNRVFHPLIHIFDATQTAIQVLGICAAPAGLWVTPYSSQYIPTNGRIISLHHKSGASAGQFTGTSFPTFCTFNEVIESDPVTRPDTCLLWCVDQHYSAHVAYSIPNSDCCQPPPPLPGETCENVIEIHLNLEDLPFSFSGNTSGMTHDITDGIPVCSTGTGPDVIYKFCLPTIPESTHLELSVVADFDAYFELHPGGACQASRVDSAFAFHYLPPDNRKMEPIEAEDT